MVDSRFFSKPERQTLDQICKILGIDVPRGSDPHFEVSGFAKIDEATSTEITFMHNAKYADKLAGTKAFACLITEKYAHLLPRTTVPLIVEAPYLALAILLKRSYSIHNPQASMRGKTFIAKSAVVAEDAIVEDGCYISDHVVIHSGAIIKSGTFVGPNTTILHGVEVGDGSHIESNVTIGFAIIGKSAYIKTGARIGQQGFGFYVGDTYMEDVMQIGRVLIGDNTQIGANCTIDRGSMGDTKIGNYVRVDNMVYLAHNVEIGDCCILAAHVCLAGSVKVGKSCMMGGQVGIAGHISIGDSVMIAAQSGVINDIESHAKVAGSPAENIMTWRKQMVALRKLA
ncbi:MAG: UDP-3-O-(3-hydroxymyristoyl)glucosamine N-acyltransferase [Holosporales bacterium]|jgi:UDP-3-O-[3-hydroxymyristoyl] glucosamine N-acyltransferase|nr:UDP-3-O-(3-hydroxymyristoyl)glucosamine N-acyltransferase [Holosporales bacterium]